MVEPRLEADRLVKGGEVVGEVADEAVGIPCPQQRGRRADQLAIWYQPDDMTAWDQQATKLDMELWWLSASIAHFSNYAVSY